MNWEGFFAIGGLFLVLGSVLVAPVLIWSRMKTKGKVKIKCTSCGEVSCFITTQNQLQNFAGETLCESGVIYPNPLIKIPNDFEDWVIGDQDKYSYCYKCGYYERLQQSAPNKKFNSDGVKSTPPVN